PFWSRSKTFDPPDVPLGKSEGPSRPGDAINIVICRRLRFHGCGEVTQRGQPLAFQGLHQDRLGQVGLTQDILGVGVEATEFLMRSRGDDAVDTVLVGADQVRRRLDANIEAAQFGYLPAFRDEVHLLEDGEVDVGSVEEGPNFRLGHAILSLLRGPDRRLPGRWSAGSGRTNWLGLRPGEQLRGRGTSHFRAAPERAGA